MTCKNGPTQSLQHNSGRTQDCRARGREEVGDASARAEDRGRRQDTRRGVTAKSSAFISLMDVFGNFNELFGGKPAGGESYICKECKTTFENPIKNANGKCEACNAPDSVGQWKGGAMAGAGDAMVSAEGRRDPRDESGKNPDGGEAEQVQISYENFARKHKHVPSSNKERAEPLF